MPRRATGLVVGFGIALALACSAGSREAAANGRFPAAGQVARDPDDASSLVVRATYGLLSTRTGGEPWAWSCEEAVGWSGTEDPPIAVLRGGAVIAGLFDGLAISRDGGCGWSFEPGAAGSYVGRYAVDVSVDRARPDHAVVLFSNGVTPETYDVEVAQTADGGATFERAGAKLPANFLGLNLDVAESDPARIYVSGRLAKPDYRPAIARTVDRGATWEVIPIDAAVSEDLAYLSAIDPVDPLRLYARTDGADVDRLLVSVDGGATWSHAFDGPDLLGFALSADGAQVFVGGQNTGLWRAPRETLAFEQLGAQRIECLAAFGAELYACASEAKDGFTVGVSRDAGASFEPILHRNVLCEQLACPEGSSVAAECTGKLEAVQQLVGSTSCDEPGPAATATGSGGAASTSGAGAGGGAAGDDGCACSVPTSARGSRGLSLVALALAAASIVRRSVRKTGRRGGGEDL